MKFTMREYFQASTDFDEAYGTRGNNVDEFLSDPTIIIVITVMITILPQEQHPEVKLVKNREVVML